ncbi:flagellar basal body-associated protein FliL [Bacillus sp. DNRA2]|uniref:flagellar basal body-associated FliL family protein n=1 Tax=Bacillus sp. DNRA2 TaxID=2723053 RepID=UPI00145E2BEF|nr:flagellar basal body-associated FliL family protein [Bacillus sp. DNRA2]NMD69113.1 flagellar basal body-associated protein FliL [Bacillus sp. DNRA2]
MKAKLKVIIIMALSAIVLLGVIWFGLTQLTKKEEKPKGLSADEIVETSVETEMITTNLGSGGYIQLRFRIQASNKDAVEELTERNFQVRNIVLRLAASMTTEEAKSANGMIKFEEDMKNQLNELLQSGTVIRVYTTDKIIQ